MNSHGQRLDRLTTAHCFRAALSKPEVSEYKEVSSTVSSKAAVPANGLKAPWGAAGTDPHLKAEEPRV